MPAPTPLPYDIIYVHLHGGGLRVGDFKGVLIDRHREVYEGAFDNNLRLPIGDR